jgi:NAD(P)-dependent dehydrogenase (short-subunit alcohol dehydrogenase family)
VTWHPRQLAQQTGRTLVVTGANSGIGLEAARASSDAAPGFLSCGSRLLLYTQPVACSKNGSADGAGNQRSRKDSHLRRAGEVRVRECQASDE